MSVQMWVMENKILFSNMLNMPQWIWTCQAKMVPHSHWHPNPLASRNDDKI
jgi:hypothetical protein